MRKLIVTEFITVDGVMEDPGGAEKLDRGGWALRFDRGEDGNKFKLDELMDCDALLLGRVTYDAFADAWPSRTGDFADRMNGMPKYVVSSTLNEAPWNNTTVINGDVAAEVAKLKEEPGGEIMVAGSAQLFRTLLDHALVDELRLMIFPVVLGAGKRLFKEAAGMNTFSLSEVRQVGPDGVTILIYRPVEVSPRG